jgi:TRAP-type C4-dicarboxylate transport system permease small subunit
MLETPPFVDSPRALPEPRRRVLDNPRVLAVAFALLLALIAGLFWLSRRTAETDTQVLTDVLLYPLLAVSVALLLTLGLVLTRNLLKLWEGHRQARRSPSTELLAMTSSRCARAHQRQRDHQQQRGALVPTVDEG